MFRLLQSTISRWVRHLRFDSKYIAFKLDTYLIISFLRNVGKGLWTIASSMDHHDNNSSHPCICNDWRDVRCPIPPSSGCRNSFLQLQISNLSSEMERWEGNESKPSSTSSSLSKSCVLHNLVIFGQSNTSKYVRSEQHLRRFDNSFPVIAES